MSRKTNELAEAYYNGMLKYPGYYQLNKSLRQVVKAAMHEKDFQDYKLAPSKLQQVQYIKKYINEILHELKTSYLKVKHVD